MVFIPAVSRLVASSVILRIAFSRNGRPGSSRELNMVCSLPVTLTSMSACVRLVWLGTSIYQKRVSPARRVCFGGPFCEGDIVIILPDSIKPRYHYAPIDDIRVKAKKIVSIRKM